MHNSRRAFIKQSSLALAGATLLPSIQVEACKPVSPRVAFQLFSVEKEMMTDAKATLEALNKSGYRYIEHSNYINRTFYGYNASDFRQLVRDSGLAVISGHTVLEPKHWSRKNKIFTAEWQQVIEDASIAGQQYLITPWLDKSLWNNETALKSFMEVLNKCGELCRKSGLQFGYHNHDFEFTHYIKNNTLYDLILQYTEPCLVTHQLDIGNLPHNKYSVADLIKKHPGRFKLMHIKNVQESEARHERYETAPLHDGLLNLKEIIQEAQVSGGTTEFILDQGNDGPTSLTDIARHHAESVTRYLHPIQPSPASGSGDHVVRIS